MLGIMVDKVFVPQVVNKLSAFLKEYDKSKEICSMVAVATSKKVSMVEPNVLDIRQPATELINNFLALMEK